MYINLDSRSVDIDLVSWTFLCKLVFRRQWGLAHDPRRSQHTQVIFDNFCEILAV